MSCFLFHMQIFIWLLILFMFLFINGTLTFQIKVCQNSQPGLSLSVVL